MTWALVYRTEKYQKLKMEIEKQSKKLERLKEAHGEVSALDRSKKKKLEQVTTLIFSKITGTYCKAPARHVRRLDIYLIQQFG